MSTSGERWLGPSEAAAKLGVTVKALRVFGRAGLVKPDRTAGSWRVYGPAQIARIHTILVMRELGLSLKAIGGMPEGRSPSLSAVPAAEQDALEQKGRKVAEAIDQVRAARLRIARGEALSMDDFIHLSRETVMEDATLGAEAKAGFEAHLRNNVPDAAYDAMVATWRPEIAAVGLDGVKAELGIFLPRCESWPRPAIREARLRRRRCGGGRR